MGSGMGRISAGSGDGAAAWLFFLLHMLPVISAAAAPPVLQTGFCSRAIASATCPSPPTFDSLNLTAYSGSWFQIGVTGRFQLQTEPGLVCAKALYTLPGDGSVSVLNSAVSILSPPGSIDVSVAGSATAAACSAARSACIAAASGSDNATRALEAAAGRISRIQALLIEVSEGNFTAGIGSRIKAEAEALRRVEARAIRAAAPGRGAARKEVVRRARAIEKAARVMVKRGRSIERGSGVAVAVPTATGVPGRAVQVKGGKLEVSFFGGPAAPYWVLAVEGDYEAALVYSCTDVGGGGGGGRRQDKSLYILSRSATLPASTVSRFLSLAASFSIPTDCDDAFFLTRQTSCSAVP